MRLYYDPVATGSRAVHLFAAEAGIDIDLVYVGLAHGEQHAESFAAINPNRQVPVLDDDGFVLTETSAILRYLADTVGSPAYPTERRARALVDARLDWFNTSFARDAVYGLAYARVLPDRLPDHPEAAAQMLQRARQGTERWLTVLDRHWIADRGFVAGAEITIADFLGSTFVKLLDIVDYDLRPYPAVRGWMRTMHALPHWDACYAAFEGMLAAMKTRPALAG